MNEEIEQRVKHVISEFLGGYDKVSPESTFIRDLGFDDLDVILIVMELEKEFEIEIGDEETDEIRKEDYKVKDLVKTVSDIIQQGT